MKKISVYTEVNFIENKLEEVSYELISKAFDLSKKALELTGEEYIIEAIALADVLDEESINKAYKAGASRFVFVKSQCLKKFCQTIFAQCFMDYYKTSPSEIVIFPATTNGRIVAPRIATMLETGLVADCTGLDLILKDEVLKFAPTRPTFGSELMATILSKTNPQCATVRPKTFEAKFDKDIKGELVNFEPTFYQENRLKLVNTLFEKSADAADLVNTKIVLAAGYGLVEGKSRTYFEKLEELASLIGARVGSTRKIVDIGLMDQSTQIGITGVSVTPDVYIAFGISGAIQHVMGMKNSKKIIAINTDENAEIFNYSDYKIVADAKKVIDELLAKFGG